MYTKLKEIRKKNNFSIYDMAEKIGLTASHYYMIENGQRILFYDMAIKIAHTFNMKPDDIFYTEKIKFN